MGKPHRRDPSRVTLDTFKFVQPSELDKPLEFHYQITVTVRHQAGTLLLLAPASSALMPSPSTTSPHRPIDLNATPLARHLRHHLPLATSSMKPPIP